MYRFQRPISENGQGFFYGTGQFRRSCHCSRTGSLCNSGVHPGETPAGNAAGVPNDQVRKVAEDGELEAALQMLLPAFEKDATLQLARLHSTEKYFQQGLVTEAEWSQEKLKIKFAILELAE
ncbi:MAG: hypothetical protein IPG32_15180 [Saprospirales bacterium]|nr:hypothetical protein [Saprospirales bacterium]